MRLIAAAGLVLGLAAMSLNFLLGCSENSLASFELAKLAEVADLRKELHAVLDRLLDQMSQATIAGWFRLSDRTAIKYADGRAHDSRWATKR